MQGVKPWFSGITLFGAIMGNFGKGGFQTNQYAHYWKNGLLNQVFGTNWTKNPNGLQETMIMEVLFLLLLKEWPEMPLRPYVVAHPFDNDIGLSTTSR